MFTRLGTRLTVIFIGLVIIPIVAVAIIFAVRTVNILVENSIRNQSEATQNIQNQISSVISESVNELKLLNELYTFEQLSIQQQGDVLSSLLSNRETYEQLAVVNADGVERIRLSRFKIVSAAELRDRSNDEVFQAVVATGEVQFSSVYFDEVSGNPILTIGVPFFNVRSGMLSSIVLAEFRFRPIWNLVAELQSRPAYRTTTIFLVDDTGHLVAHANPSIVLRGTVFNPPTEDGQVTGLDGEAAIITTQTLPLGNINFVVVSQEHVTDALQPAFDTLLNVGLVAIITLVIAALLVAAVVRQVVSPIEALSRTAQTIRSGSLDARAAITSRDEIGTLAHSFNDMASQLQGLIQTLEDRVTERVRDLTLASDVSRQITTELDSVRLLQHVTELTAATFNLYHVSIFLYDPNDQTIRLRQGTGTIGERMVSAGKQFHIDDQGLVPQSARTREARLSNDVLVDVGHVKNPLLPDTRSELALPMVFQGQLIGVLDLQSQAANRFRDEDIRIMTTLAEQIAVAVRNAQLFEQAQSALVSAERANSVKSAFLASMSHELRTPLNAVINYTKFVARGLMGPVTDKQVETLNKVANSGTHLLNLINDVLDISKIESGSLQLFIEDNVDLHEIIHNVMETAETLVADKPIELHQEIDTALPPITGDRQRILQVMLNIMSNACKFTEQGHITLSVHQQDGEVVVTVKDTGAGIAPEDHSVVFELFKQTTTGLRHGGGTGLGMPITKSLVEAHGGRIWLNSALGQGSTFYVALPIKSAELIPTIA